MKKIFIITIGNYEIDLFTILVSIFCFFIACISTIPILNAVNGFIGGFFFMISFEEINKVEV